MGEHPILVPGQLISIKHIVGKMEIHTCQGPSTRSPDFLMTAPSGPCVSTSISPRACLRYWTANNTSAPRAMGIGYHLVGVDQA